MFATWLPGITRQKVCRPLASLSSLASPLASDHDHPFTVFDPRRLSALSRRYKSPFTPYEAALDR